MTTFPSLGIQIPDLFLPNPNIDLQKWAVIACDQFTSQPDYWEQVAEFVGPVPSTLHMILPEIFLGKSEEISRTTSTQQKMREYLHSKVLVQNKGMVYVERAINGKNRRGLMLALDLEKYDFSKGSQSLIRATEGTILDRLPPRIKIREKASLELPHILVLIDDPEDLVIGCIEKNKESLPISYDFDLMMSSGHLTGRLVQSPELEKRVIEGLEKLAQTETFCRKYGVTPDRSVLLFAVGDGNHSLATAKSIWEKIKPAVGMDHPARYALVEIENVHDKGLSFEPIHRVLFNTKEDPTRAIRKYFGSDVTIAPAENENAMKRIVNSGSSTGHCFGLITSNGFQIVSVKNPKSNLAVATLQEFLDSWIESGGVGQIDYVHGDDVVVELGSKPDNAGFYLAGMSKNDLFKTVLLDGSLPRKTFSMGEAQEKRFYMESRKIITEE
ncbi:MAG: DUF1015 domain-containing protein [Chloroflexi bacterium]|nr:DUF1015 domain-containing protein [Chloroflexota bacterium]